MFPRPHNTVEETVLLDGETWTIWEFPFKATRTFGGIDLAATSGRIFHPERLIIIDSGQSIRDKKWTRDHEIAHALMRQEGSDLEDTFWDEFECELMVLSKTDERDYCRYRREIYNVLKKFLNEGTKPRQRARMLVNWLRERVDDEEEEGPSGSVRLPKAALRTNKWWDRVTD